MKTKVLLFLFLVFIAGKITAQKPPEQFKKYKNEITLRLPLLNGYYHSFYQKNKMALGLGAEIGLLGGWNILLLTDEESSGTLYPYDFATVRMEFVKIMPFIKYYYNKNNYFNAGLYYAVALGPYDGYSTEFNFYGTTGLNLSIFYGWDLVKFGMGIQAGALTYRLFTNNNNTFIEFEPLIISISF